MQSTAAETLQCNYTTQH